MANTNPYLTFSSPNSFTLATANSAKNWNGILEYSTDLENWATWDGTTTISSSNNTEHVLYVRGTDNSYITGVYGKGWTLTGSNISCSGNIENLLNHEAVTAGEHPNMGDSCYSYLFYNCRNLTTPPELPATTLEYDCYGYMFYNCTSLTTAPELPATTLKYACYRYMFQGCTNLTTAPELPATTLAPYCYRSMFYGCTSLTIAPELPATTLKTYCYSSMFRDCTSLTTPPELPATTLAESCYESMFMDCASLTIAPRLPATTLTPASYCYYYMFRDCTSLTTPPDLPATTLAESCYQYMFQGCTSLATTPELPATALAEDCYRSMFYGCTNLTKVPELPATTLKNYCYVSMFSDCTGIKLSAMKTSMYSIPYRVPTSGDGITASSALSYMFSRTGGTFTGTPEINTTYYLYDYELEAELETATLKFSSPSSFSLATANSAKNWDGTLQYSTNLISWSTWSGTTTLNAVKNGSKYLLYLRGTNNSVITGSFDKKWTLTGSNISCSGNIENLLDYEVVSTGKHPSMSEGCFTCLFYSCMNLITPPELPATTLAKSCYNSMFCYCTNLTTAPKLPATILAANCYSGMFDGCANLTTAPKLPATTLANSCYSGMFRKCTNLTTAPKLPATTLANSCYSGMFASCKRLTMAPKLPATTLANSCYSTMFYSCTSLTTAPKLPATTLANNCYKWMFYECTSLKLSTTQVSKHNIPYKIPSSGTGVIATGALTDMFTNTGGTFTGTPDINTTYYLYIYPKYADSINLRGRIKYLKHDNLADNLSTASSSSIPTVKAIRDYREFTTEQYNAIANLLNLPSSSDTVSYIIPTDDVVVDIELDDLVYTNNGTGNPVTEPVLELSEKLLGITHKEIINDITTAEDNNELVTSKATKEFLSLTDEQYSTLIDIING